MKRSISLSIFGLLLLSSQHAAATMITFDSWVHTGGSDPADYVVTVNDNTSGVLTFGISVNTSTLPDADLFGFFFDTNGIINAGNPTTITGPDVTGVYYDTLSCGGQGCNLNGLTSDTFDVAVRLQDSGSNNGNLIWTNFTVALVTGLSIYDIDRVGVRAQSSGLTGNGSDKAMSSIGTVSVPEPASVALLGAGLMVLGFSRKFSRS